MMPTKKQMALVFISAMIFIGFQAWRTDGHATAAAKTDSVRYAKQIIPLLKRHCMPCHLEDNMNPSELYFDTYGDLIKGGRHGSPVIPGKPDSSLLLKKLSANPPFGDRMPLRARRPLPADTIELFRKWILQGAKNN